MLSPNPPCQQESGRFGPNIHKTKGCGQSGDWPPPDSESLRNDSSQQLKRRLCTATTCDKQGDCWKHEAAALTAAVLVKLHLEPRGSRWHMGPWDRRLRAPPGSCYGSEGGGGGSNWQMPIRRQQNEPDGGLSFQRLWDVVKVSATVFDHCRFLFVGLNHKTFSAKFRGGFLQNKVIQHEVLSLLRRQNKKLFCVFCPLGTLQPPTSCLLEVPREATEHGSVIVTDFCKTI